MTTSPFRHCPQCCSGEIEFRDNKQLICLNCHFCYFHNVATAVGAVIRHGTEILLAVRGREPARGMLDLPGGFTDPGESLEQALQREMKEELGVEFSNPRYLFSFANTYVYADVVYQTTDAIFEFRLKQKPTYSGSRRRRSGTLDRIAGSEPKRYRFRLYPSSHFPTEAATKPATTVVY